VKKLFLAFSLIGLLSCGDEEKVKVPKDLLPPAKLTSILADIHLAESRVELMRVSPDTATVVFKRLQAEIFKKQNVSEKDFLKTYDFYLNNIKELDKIYERLVDTLGMREIKVSSTKPSTADTTGASELVDTTGAAELKKEKMLKIRKQMQERKADSKANPQTETKL